MVNRTVLFEVRGHIAYVTLNRPQHGNAIDSCMADELCRIWQGITDNEDIRVAILTGAGASFCSGQETGEMQPVEAALQARGSEDCFDALAELNRPVIAAINGDAISAGLELALCCDVRIAAEGARFGLPEVAQGTIPGHGGTQRLPRIVGKAKALELVLLGETIDTREAQRICLVNKVVAPDELLPTAEALARRIASLAPIAERYAKEAVNKGADLTLEQGLRLEGDLTVLLQTTDDRTEGVAAFLGKRTPNFKGR